MIGNRVLICLVTILLTANHMALAQIVERSDGDGLKFQFTDAMLGRWEIAKVVSSGNDLSAHYGPPVFTRDTWTIQTRTGDHVYKLSSVNESSVPLEATFENVKHNSLSFTAFIRLENNQLTIVRGNGFKSPIPLPRNMDEGPKSLVYVFNKSVEDEPSDKDARPPLNVRLIDNTDGSQILADLTVKPFYGGKLTYDSNSPSTSRVQNASPRLGTVLIGKIEPRENGTWAVSLVVELGRQVETDQAETTILRSETLSIETIITAGKTVRINCGENRTCELTL